METVGNFLNSGQRHRDKDPPSGGRRDVHPGGGKWAARLGSEGL